MLQGVREFSYDNPFFHYTAFSTLCLRKHTSQEPPNVVINKGLSSKIYKQLMMIGSIKTKKPTKKMGRILKQTFGDNRHMKRCSAPLIIRDANQNCNEVSHHTSQNGCYKKKSMNNKCRKDCGEKGTLLHCWQEGKLLQPLWETVWRFF